MQRQLKSPAGAGSQFDSFSAPDGSVLKIKTAVGVEDEGIAVADGIAGNPRR
jgi:3D (Asp-Asp-Asp) domain-containing protein